MEPQKEIGLKLNNYENKGLYLIFKDSTRLVLSRDNIERTSTEFWNNPVKIPAKVKEMKEFQKCTFCPLKDEEGFCNALWPILPFLDIIDKYVSHDQVTAIYKGEEKEICHVSDTTMQEALKYISILSLMQYCQFGKGYWKYYFGIIPLSGGKDLAIRMYLNMYWLYNGNKNQVDAIISEFIEKLRIATQNQVKRLNMICKNDAFLNAFVNTQISTEFLSMDIENILKTSFDTFEKSI